MAEDYGKLTSAQLKDELKRRGIPQTGMTRKQQFVERLLQHDQENAETSHPEPVPSAEQPEADLVDTAPQTAAEPDAVNTVGGFAGGLTETSPAGEKAATSADEVSKTTDTSKPLEDSNEPDASPKTTETTTIEPSPKVQESHGAVGGAEEEDQQPTTIIESSKEATPVPPQESNKRKRRSVTPPLSPAELAAKKFKHDADTPEVILKEDVVSAETKGFVADPEAGGPDMPEKDKDHEDKPADTIVPEKADTRERTTDDIQASSSDKWSIGKNNNKYKDLIPNKNSSNVQSLDDTLESTGEDEENARVVEAPIHPVSRALYVRDIMRPLPSALFKDHLVKLSKQPAENIEAFYLDDIRTHCFIVFGNADAASRVRTLLHQRVWPAERNRTPLWVDFVPEEKVKDWIEMEVATDDGKVGNGHGAGRRPSGIRRWEVIYEEMEDGSVETSLQEAKTAKSQPIKRAGMAATTTGVSTNESSTAATPSNPPQGISQTPTATNPPQVVALDTLFKSTTAARPKLYYLPVDEAIATQRLESIHAMLSSRIAEGEGVGGERDRYTFEEDTKFVSNGPEFGLHAERQRLRRAIGGPRGRSGRGDSWRA